MSAAEFEQIMAQVHPMGENFYLHLMGEPLSHPQLCEILDICNKYNVKTNITTNGTLLGKTGRDVLSKEIRNVSVSLHSFEANSLNISLQKYLEGIADFCLPVGSSQVKKSLAKKAFLAVGCVARPVPSSPLSGLRRGKQTVCIPHQQISCVTLPCGKSLQQSSA